MILGVAWPGAWFLSSAILGPVPAYYSHPQSMRQLTTYDNSQFLNPYMLDLQELYEISSVNKWKLCVHS